MAVSVTAVLKVVIVESMPAFSLIKMVRGAKFLRIKAWKVSNTLGSFSFLKSDLSLVCFGLLILFRRSGRSSSASRGHVQCLLLENFVFWKYSCLVGSASSLECNQSGCVVHLGYARSKPAVKVISTMVATIPVLATINFSQDLKRAF